MVFKVAVTGGIASGKTTVCKILSDKLDCKYFNCDSIVSDLYNNSEFCKKIFSNKKPYSTILNSSNVVDKIKLKELILQNPPIIKEISEIIWVEVKEIILKIFNQNNKDKIILFEVPMLFESDFDKIFDFKINIESAEAKRIERAELLNIDKNLFQIILRNQYSNDFRRGNSNFTIYNNGDIKLLNEGIEQFIKMIQID